MINLHSRMVENSPAVNVDKPAVNVDKEEELMMSTNTTIEPVSVTQVTDTEEDKVANEQSTVSDASPGFFEIVRRYASLSDLLRLSGAVTVAIAMGLFLLDGIEVVNDLQRFLTMLGLTGALTAAGLAMSVFLKEQRGSRVFISLALLSVPVWKNELSASSWPLSNIKRTLMQRRKKCPIVPLNQGKTQH